MFRYSFLILFVLFFISCQKSEEKTLDRFPEGKSKEYITVGGITVPDKDLELSLYAAEPMLFNPTNMDIDHKGRVWICEAYNYRNDVNNVPYEKKGDKIIILEDLDGDGIADTSKVFYQGEDINAALGICVLGNKVIVSASPYVYVFTDEDGDDIPDKKEILFKTKGGLQSDHGVHSVVFGPDGKLYFTFGNHGLELQDKDGNPLRDIYGRLISQTLDPYQDGMAFRCDVDGSNIEVLGWNFRNNYELAVDSYGRIWQSDNDDDGVRSNRINYLMPFGNYGYKDEISGADWRAYRTNKEAETWEQHWHQNDPGVVPNLKIIGAGSPTGTFVYEGDLMPGKYHETIFLGDAVNNDIIAYGINKEGAGYSLSSSIVMDASQKDQWFRPSDVATAPDGSVFVADWYDVGVGGHFIGDLEKGRIYRLTPKNHQGYQIPTYDYEDIDSCIEALKNPSNSVRYLAFTALKKFGKQAEEALYTMAKGDNPIFTARALWLLKDLDEKYIEEFSASPNEDIRGATVRMVTRKDHSVFLEKMAQDSSYQVKQAVATQIYLTDNPKAWLSLAQSYQANDRWFLEALGIGAYKQWDNYLESYLTGKDWLNDATAKDIIWRSRAKNTASYLAEIIRNSNSYEAILRYYRALDFQNKEAKNNALLDLLSTSTSEREKVLIFKHFDQESVLENEQFTQILPKVLDGINDDRDFLDIALKYRLTNHQDRIVKILDQSQEREVWTQAAAVANELFGLDILLESIRRKPLDVDFAVNRILRMGTVDNDPTTRQLILVFTNKKYPFEMREAAVLAMEGYASDVRLWDLVKVNKVSPELIPAAIQVLRKTFHNNIKVEFEHMFGKPEEGPVVMPDFENNTGDPIAGKEIYSTYCSVCHKVGDSGSEFGPGLSDIGKKLTKGALFNAIVYPAQGISLGYETSILNLHDGTSLKVIVTSQTGEGYWVKIIGDEELRLFRNSEVKSVEIVKNESLMPAFPFPEQEMLDLIEYLSELK